MTVEDYTTSFDIYLMGRIVLGRCIFHRTYFLFNRKVLFTNWYFAFFEPPFQQ